MRINPILPLIASMLLQGPVLTFFFEKYANQKYTISKGLRFGALMATFFVSYLAFVEPSKYSVQDVVSWMLVERITGMVQFVCFVVSLSLAFRKLPLAKTS